MLKESARRLHLGVDSKKHPWERDPDNFFQYTETIRQISSSLFGGDADGYAVVPSVSYGISTASRILEGSLTPVHEILLIDEEFPSVVYPFARVAKETGAQLTTVKIPTDGNWTNAIVQHINENTKVVALSSCHWTNGAYIDLLAIREACTRVGACLVLDTTQSMGAMPFSIDTIKPDFMAAAGYKWMLCPYGFSLLYVDEKWRNSRPLEESWLAREKAHDFANLVNYSETYMTGSRRFEMGEKCMPTILPGAIAALEQIQKWGIETIANSLQQINQSIAEHLLSLGFQLPEASQRCPHMLGATIPADYTDSIVNELKAQQVFISQRGNSLRFAPHLHITNHDIDRFKHAITKLVR